MSDQAQVPAVIQDSGFDLDTLDAIQEATYKCGVVFDADGNPLTGFIIASKNSTEYIDAARKIRVNAVMRNHKRKKDVDATTPEGASVVIDGIVQNDRVLALTVVVGWFGFKRGGQPLAFDKSLLPSIFDKAPQWQNAVLVALENEANFTQASSQAS